MTRRATALLAVLAVAGLVAAPSDALAKRARPVALTQYLNWGGDCTGGGYLAVEHVPNPDSCALFFPELGSSYHFGGAQGLPLVLDADQVVTVDFTLSTVASAAADFEAVLSATVGGKQVEVGSATTNVMAAGPGGMPVHFDLDPPAELHQAKITGLNLTITWSNGFTYSSIDLDSGTARMVVRGFK